MSKSSVRKSIIPFHTSTWSSDSTIWIVAFIVMLHRGGIAKRYGQSYSRTFPRRRLDLKVAVNILGSFIHIKKSATGINIDVAGFHDFLVKSAAFIGYRDDQVVLVLPQQHVNFRRS